MYRYVYISDHKDPEYVENQRNKKCLFNTNVAVMWKILFKTLPKLKFICHISSRVLTMRECGE